MIECCYLAQLELICLDMCDLEVILHVPRGSTTPASLNPWLSLLINFSLKSASEFGSQADSYAPVHISISGVSDQAIFRVPRFVCELQAVAMQFLLITELVSWFKIRYTARRHVKFQILHICTLGIDSFLNRPPMTVVSTDEV